MSSVCNMQTCISSEGELIPLLNPSEADSGEPEARMVVTAFAQTSTATNTGKLANAECQAMEAVLSVCSSALGQVMAVRDSAAEPPSCTYALICRVLCHTHYHSETFNFLLKDSSQRQGRPAHRLQVCPSNKPSPAWNKDVKSLLPASPRMSWSSSAAQQHSCSTGIRLLLSTTLACFPAGLGCRTGAQHSDTCACMATAAVVHPGEEGTNE